MKKKQAMVYVPFFKMSLSLFQYQYILLVQEYKHINETNLLK